MQDLKARIQKCLKAYNETSEYVEKRDLSEWKRKLDKSIEEMTEVDHVLEEKRTWVQQNPYNPDRNTQPINYAEYKVVLRSYNETFQVGDIKASRITSHACLSCSKNTFWLGKFDECTKILNALPQANPKIKWDTTWPDAYIEVVKHLGINPVADNVNIMLREIVEKK